MAKHSKTKLDPNVERVRRFGLIGFATVIALGVVLATLYVSGIVFSPDGDGPAFEIITNAQPPAKDDPLVVTEFFSYGCSHCRDFDPDLEAWRSELPPNVQLERSPVVFGSAQYRVFAQTFYALKALNALDQNHERIFDAIHGGGRSQWAVEDFAALVDGNGTDAAAFRRMYSSSRVRALAKVAEDNERTLGIRATPTLIVANYYRINVGVVGRRRALTIADDLIQQIRKGVHNPATKNEATRTTP